MAIRVKGLRHVLVPADRLVESERFYGEVLGLGRTREPATGYPFSMSWFRVGEQEVHVATKDPGFTDRVGVTFNPTLQPHVAFEVEDIDEARRVLEAYGIPYYEIGKAGVLSRRQLFLRDPAGMVVELYEERGSAE